VIALVLALSELIALEPVAGRDIARDGLALELLEYDVGILDRSAVLLIAAGWVVPVRDTVNAVTVLLPPGMGCQDQDRD
jgi:hypothetical protein